LKYSVFTLCLSFLSDGVCLLELKGLLTYLLTYLLTLAHTGLSDEEDINFRCERLSPVTTFKPPI